MGNVRLIGHLFNRRVVNHKIVHVCVQQLLSGGTGKISGKGSNAHVHENCIECACELVSLTAKQLGENEASNKLVASYFARLEQLLKDKSLSSRVRFLIKDVQELKKAKWVPRKEANTAKKISEIHAQAKAELGMAVSTFRCRKTEDSWV